MRGLMSNLCELHYTSRPKPCSIFLSVVDVIVSMRLFLKFVESE